MMAASARESYRSSAPLCLQLRSSKGFIGFTAFIATFTDGFLYGSVVPVLPFSLVDRSGVPEKDVQFWISILFMTFGLTTAIGSPIAGWAAYRTPRRKRLFLIGLGVAFIATVLFCFGVAPWVLVLARAFQGLSAPLMNTTGLALIADSVRADEIGSWIGFVLSGMNLGLLISPFIGGALYERAGYYAVFAVVFGVIAFDFCLRVAMIEKRVASRWLEEARLEDSRSGCGGTQVGSETSDDCTRDSDPRSGELRSEEQHSPVRAPDENSPLLHASDKKSTQSWFAKNFPTSAVLLSSRRLRAAVFGGFTHTLLITSFDAILPLFVKHTFGWNSTGGGLIFLAITIPSLLGTFIGALSDRYGTRKVSLFGFAVIIPSLGLLGLITNNNMTDKVLLFLFLVLIGIGLNFLLGPLAADIFEEAEELDRKNPGMFSRAGAFGLSYSLFNAALGVSMVVGPGLSGLVYEKTSWQIMAVTLAVIGAIGSIPVYWDTGSVIRRGEIKDVNIRV